MQDDKDRAEGIWSTIKIKKGPCEEPLFQSMPFMLPNREKTGHTRNPILWNYTYIPSRD
jgi:hypothetical protein